MKDKEEDTNTGRTLEKNKGEYKLSRGEICVASFKVPLQMVRVWTGF